MQSRAGRIWALIAAAITVGTAGCRSSGGEEPSPPPPPPPPPPVSASLSVADASVTEGSSGATVLTFVATLDQTLSTDATVDYATADGTAVAGNDFVAASGTLTISANATTARIDIDITPDQIIEGDEAFVLNLSNPSANTMLATASAVGTILDDDVADPAVESSTVLNDTGVRGCSTATTNDLDCSVAGGATAAPPGQDGDHGRDVLDDDDSDGVAGFNFTKLNENGLPLANQSADYATSPWSCVRDNVTGLIWEVKTDDDSYGDRDWTYTWYSSSGFEDGGDPGVDNGGDCPNNCDTDGHAVAANIEMLCGFDDWRMPTRHELISIMHFGADSAPFIDTEFFPNHADMPYWSSSTSGGLGIAWVNYSDIGSGTSFQADDIAVRLVRRED
ncbi:MAG: DUF1566 domain-containing protein [Woeseiaceae bacterium]|nr:DUF1566 domain-containing protein [Woeseiaceae bacterium]